MGKWWQQGVGYLHTIALFGDPGSGVGEHGHLSVGSARRARKTCKVQGSRGLDSKGFVRSCGRWALYYTQGKNSFFQAERTGLCCVVLCCGFWYSLWVARHFCVHSVR